MLAPASLRPGSSPGDADRRRRFRLVVVAVVAAILAVLLPVAMALASDDDTGAAAGIVSTTQTSPQPEPAARPSAAVASTTAAPAVPTPASPAAPPTPAAPTAAVDAGSPDAPAADPVAVPAPASTTADAPASVADAPVAAAAPTTPSAAATPAPQQASVPTAGQPANWMEALRPQVDPEGLARWVFEARGAWGASDGHTVFIDPDVPEDKRWSVMVHEYGHVLQVRQYGSLDGTAAAMNAIVGAGRTDQFPTESNADCIAELLGATWTDYGCQDAFRPAAAALVTEDRNRIAAAQAVRP